jgi:hypothetical protein
MEKPKFIFLAIGLLLSGCLFQSSDSNPYTGMSCEEKIAKMVRELQAFEAVGQPWAKVSASDSIPADSATGIHIPSDTVAGDTVAGNSVAGDGVPPDTSSRANKTLITVFRGYPPVTGMNPDSANAIVSNADSRTEPGYVQGNDGTTVMWIPPVGFSDSNKTIPILHPDTLLTRTRETTPLKPLPRSITALQIISTGSYQAHIRILDYKLDLVREMDQEFGYNGELGNVNRDVPKGLVSYLVWDNLTASGKRVQDGVYLWKVRLTSQSKEVVDRTAKTGVIGDECKSDP